MNASSDYLEQERGSTDEETFQTSNNMEASAQSAQDQLAELHLLARADLHSPATSFVSAPYDMVESTLTIDEEGEKELHEVESRGRTRLGTGGLRSFTAILAASRKLAATPIESDERDHTRSADHASGGGVPFVPLDQTRGSLTVEVPGQRQSPKASGKSLPTLSEGAEGEEEDDEDEETPETFPIVTAPTLADKIPSSSAETAPVRQEQEPEEVDRDDLEFIEMLEHLSRGQHDFLALTVEDISTRKVERVHAALSRDTISALRMPYVRTLVAVDMLRLLLRRLGLRTIREAINRAIRQVSERDEGSDLPALLTSSNIAAVVLEVRQQLSTEATTVSPQLPRRTGPATSSSKDQVRRVPLTSPRSTSSLSSSVPSSPRCGTPRSPAPDRRSILAKEGVHVLMQEKLATFDYRGQANALPAFRFRGASSSITDSAAKRRQRGLQYANDHAAHRTIHM